MFVSEWVTKDPQLTINSTLDVSTKDTILSAGSIDTPKILLLSGIGASAHLKTHDIPVILDQPSIGLNLRDHFVVRMSAAINQDAFILPDPAVLQGAREQWLNDRSGPLAEDIAIFAVGYLKLNIASFPEYSLLDPKTQELLSHPHVPAYEVAIVRLSLFYVFHRGRISNLSTRALVHQRTLTIG